MQTFKKSIFMLLSLLTLFMYSCGKTEENNIPKEPLESSDVASFDKDFAPMRMVKSGDVYYSLFGSFNSNTFTLSVSENPDKVNEVYTSNGADIRSFNASGDYAVWCERTEERNIYKIYDSTDGKVKEISAVDTTLGYQNSNISLYNSLAYFTYIDYARQRASVMRYNPRNSITTELYTFDFCGETSIMNLSVCSNKLVVTGNVSGVVTVVISDLDGVLSDRTVALGNSVSYVYSAGYENGSDKIAIYYKADTGSEHIALVSISNSQITDIYNFGADNYAYLDNIVLKDGKLSFVLQRNADGYVADNFSFLSYNIETAELFEKENTFSFDVATDGTYLISFDTGGEYKNIIYSKAK